MTRCRVGSRVFELLVDGLDGRGDRDAGLGAILLIAFRVEHGGSQSRRAIPGAPLHQASSYRETPVGHRRSAQLPFSGSKRVSSYSNAQCAASRKSCRPVAVWSSSKAQPIPAAPWENPLGVNSSSSEAVARSARAARTPVREGSRWHSSSPREIASSRQLSRPGSRPISRSAGIAPAFPPITSRSWGSTLASVTRGRI